jgi:hypothetical protein
MIVLLILSVIAFLVWKMDLKDRSRPYGLDESRNKKVPKITGEKNGVSVYQGKPAISDTPKTRLKKITWLSSSYTKEVKWRRSLVFGIIASVLLSLMFNHDTRETLNTVFIVAGIVYFSHVYYDYHLHHTKAEYIKNHVKALSKII